MMIRGISGEGAEEALAAAFHSEVETQAVIPCHTTDQIELLREIATATAAARTFLDECDEMRLPVARPEVYVGRMHHHVQRLQRLVHTKDVLVDRTIERCNWVVKRFHFTPDFNSTGQHEVPPTHSAGDEVPGDDRHSGAAHNGSHGLRDDDPVSTNQRFPQRPLPQTPPPNGTDGGTRQREPHGGNRTPPRDGLTGHENQPTVGDNMDGGHPLFPSNIPPALYRSMAGLQSNAYPYAYLYSPHASYQIPTCEHYHPELYAYSPGYTNYPTPGGPCGPRREYSRIRSIPGGAFDMSFPHHSINTVHLRPHELCHHPGQRE